MEKEVSGDNEGLNALLSKVLQEITHKMGSGIAFEQLLDSFFESLGVLIPFDRMGIALLEEGGERIRLVWVRSKLPVDSLRKNYSSLLVSSSLREIIETGKPRIINDLEEYARLHPTSESTKLILKDKILSSLTCPLRANNNAIGVVFFSSRFKHTYDESHVHVFTPMADELSVIVEQARLRNLFAQIEKRDRAFAKVLHDLRSPLNIIEGYLDFASGEDWYESLPADVKDICNILKRNANSMVALLNELSEHNEKESLVTAFPKEVDLTEFCKELISSGKILCRSKEIEFTAAIASDLPARCFCDHNLIRRVVENLFSNAVKFSLRKTKIHFSVWSQYGRLHFSVADQGQGIRNDDLPKLFTEFGKTRTLPSEGEHSSGLGLSIAKAIVEQHGGQIYASSEFGEGSTFTFWIPLTQ